MSSPTPTSPGEQLLQDFVGGFSSPADSSALSVGLVGSDAYAPQPPAHCLRTCLGGDPNAIAERGCKFLQEAAAGRVAEASLEEGCCPQGYKVVSQLAAVGGGSAVMLSIEGRPVSGLPGENDGVGGNGENGDHLMMHLTNVSRLLERVDQVVAENTGFAEEVLQNYEQLNLIFDLTQQIAAVTDAQGIEKMLLQRVGQLIGAVTVHVAYQDGRWGRYDGADGRRSDDLPESIDEEVAAAAEIVRQQRQVHVATLQGQPLIAGPLHRLDNQVDAVLVLRPPGAEPYSSGDMMMLESLLTFGGQIISNTELHERLRQMSLEVTRAMVAAIDKKDHYTSGHSERVGFLTRLTAEELGVPPAEVQIMEWAGLLHDVGKIGIPEEILCKPGKLTAEEFEIIKRHPEMGYEILNPIASMQVVVDGVLYHHEYPDGSGYPEGRRGDDIPLVARIIHVADTFDALTSTRSYRRAFSVEKAFEIISSEKGVRIDADVADAFVRAFNRYREENADEFHERFSAVREWEGDDVPA